MKNRNAARYRCRLLTISLFILGSSRLFAQVPAVHTVNDLPAVKAKAYFSFDQGRVISGADTAGKEWDIAFQRTQLWVNSGTSGKGTTKAQLIKNTSFDKVTAASATGFIADNDNLKVIPAGSGNGWYVYDMNSHTINPAPGRVIIVQTAAVNL